ncbi:MAG: DUF3800 domain-containing protein [Vicinamibacterales bacterium]|nr:DUF3800 domain-containing protein [Vicinamibacterales bacterium]MDP6607451.1 DUF3800 domain-containing protein [Vicinamibacterales bacterium]
MLEAYCDESGIHDEAKFCVVVGFVASARNWQLFENRWANASGGVDFHGKRFFARDKKGHRVKPYNGWSDERARDYLLGLVDVIQTAAFMTPIGAVVDVKAFFRLTEGERRFLTGGAIEKKKGSARPRWMRTGAPTKPYFVGFSQCVVDAALCVRKPGLRVNFVFDQQNEFNGHALRIFQDASTAVPRDELKTRLGELIFKRKDGVGGLQAADLLAHAAYRRTGTLVGDHAELDMVTSRIRQMTHEKIRFFDRDMFEDRLSKVPGPVRRRLMAS